MNSERRTVKFAAFARFSQLVGAQFGALGLPEPEEQSGEYESGQVTIGAERWRLRTARVTPKKPGAFVALWQRNAQGETCPFEADEKIAGLLLFVREDERFGVFQFTAEHLELLGITRSARHPGKRGFRIYPSWSTGLNRQAAFTQRLQAEAFTELGASHVHPQIARVTS